MGLLQTENLLESHCAKPGDISFYGQESNATNRRLAIRGIEAYIGKEHVDTFRNIQHPDLRADYLLANGSMSSNQSGEVHRISTIYPPCA